MRDTRRPTAGGAQTPAPTKPATSPDGATSAPGKTRVRPGQATTDTHNPAAGADTQTSAPTKPLTPPNRPSSAPGITRARPGQPAVDTQHGRAGAGPQTPAPTKGVATPNDVASAPDDFDLQDVTRATIGDRKWTLDELVEAVYKATPAASLHVAYKTALRDYVRHQLGARTGQMSVDDQVGLAGSGADPDSGPDQRSGDSHSGSVGAGQNVARSRASRFRELYRAGFRRQVHVGAGVWQPLLDCTRADLLFAAAECRVMAAGNVAAAERYELLAAQVSDTGKVADLPDDVIKRFAQ